MKRVLAVLMLCILTITAIPALAAGQKSVTAFQVFAFNDGLFEAYGPDGTHCLYDEDGKQVLEAPGPEFYFETSTVDNSDGITEKHLLVDGKCVKISTYDNQTGMALYGLMSIKGKMLCECEYDMINRFSDGIAVVRQGDKFGYINTSGKLVGKCQWDSVTAFNNGVAAVKKGDKYSVLNKKGKAIAKGYVGASSPVDGYVAVRTSKGWGVIDSAGKQVIDCKYERISFCGNGIVGVWQKKNNKDTYSLMTLKGKVLTKKNTWPTGMYNDGLVIVNYEAKDKKVHAGAANKKGKVVLDFGINYNYSGGYSADKFINGLTYIRQIPKTYDPKKSTWGFQDTKGNWIIALKSRKYEPKRWLNEKLISIQSLGESTVKYGVINTKGKVLCECEWDSIEDYIDGLAEVTKLKKSKEGDYYTSTIGYVNTKGEVVIPCKYDSSGSNTRKGLAVVKNSKGMAACFNKKGEKVLSAKYSSIVIGDKVIAAVKDGKMLYFDLKGKPIMEEEAPAKTPAPAQEETPVTETTPAEETAPTQEETPAAETTPAEETAPAQEEAPAENTETPADTGEAA